MPRFVVLRHECPPGYARGSHWDFMLDLGDVLKTWALLESPDRAATQPAELLADHRRHYLEFEGDVSGGRGTVSRWDAGQFELISGALNDPSAQVVVALSGRKLNGTARLAQIDGGWSYVFIDGATTA